MGAPKRNRNAGKWTAKTVGPYLTKLKRAAGRKENLFVGQQLVKMGLYRDVWSYWKEIFAGNEVMKERMNCIEDMYEVNLFRAAIDGRISCLPAILGLRNAHGWKNEAMAERGMVKRMYEEEVMENESVFETCIGGARP